MGRTLRLDPGFPVRLRAFFDALGYSDRKIAHSLEITPAAISSALAGRSYLAPENLGKLHSLYRLNINWLLSGHGEMFVGGPAAEAARIAAPAAKPFVGAGRPGRMFTAPAHDPITQLERLAVLKEKGLLTDDELAALKVRILSS